MEIPLYECVVRLLVSLVLGAVVGYEREVYNHPAGLRTHILVCMGATVFTILSISDLMWGVQFRDLPSSVHYSVVNNPSRIAAQIVTGIGFIGGGAVLRHGATVKGITTAASLWMMASIGMLVGSGHYALAVVATMLSYVVLFVFGKVGLKMGTKQLTQYNRLRLLVSIKTIHSSPLVQWMEEQFRDHILELQSASASESEMTHMTYILDTSNIRVNVNDLSRRINGFAGVTSAGIRLYFSEEVDVSG